MSTPSGSAVKGAPRSDIRALLLIALDEKPPDNLPDKVMARIALLTTAVEFGRLFVEPRICAQLELLHAAQDARVPLALSCVATCGGAREALGSTNFDYSLLSTGLAYDADERRELAALVQAARARGTVVLSFGPGDLSAFGLPVHESLSFTDVAFGCLSEALERACQCAQVDWTNASR